MANAKLWNWHGTQLSTCFIYFISRKKTLIAIEIVISVKQRTHSIADRDHGVKFLFSSYSYEYSIFKSVVSVVTYATLNLVVIKTKQL